MKEIIAYVGNDVHQETITMAVYLDGEKNVFIEKTIKNNKIKVMKFYKKLKEKYDVKACYEAGGCGYTFYRWLKKMDLKCDVIAPSLIPKKSGDRIKTDKRDANNLAKLYRAGELTSIHVPDEKEEAVRSVTRLREQLVKEIKQSKQYILKFLQLRDLVYREGSNWTQKHISYLKKLIFSKEEERFTFDRYLSLLEYKNIELEEVEKKIKEISEKKEYKESVNKLISFKGIEVITAMTIISEVVDFRRFGNARSFMSYLGLVPGQDSSGCTRKDKGITKCGNTRVRRVLIESSWHYRHRPNISRNLKKRQENQKIEVKEYSWLAQKRLNKRYQNLHYKGKTTNKIIVALAREFSGFIWSLMTRKERYSEGEQIANVVK